MAGYPVFFSVLAGCGFRVRLSALDKFLRVDIQQCAIAVYSARCSKARRQTEGARPIADLDEMISTLRELNEPVPRPARLPTPEEVRAVEAQTGVVFHPDLSRYLLEASDVAFSVLEPVTISDPKAHTHFPKVLESARDFGVPLELIPICEDNADFYCINSSGEVVFWSHNGSTDESWNSLADWIAQVWIGEAE